MSNTVSTSTRNCRAKDPSRCRYHSNLAGASQDQIAAADRAELENDYNADRSREAFRARHSEDIYSIARALYPNESYAHIHHVLDGVRNVLPGLKSAAGVTNAEVEEVTRNLYPGEPLANHAVDVRAALQKVAKPYVYKPGFDVMDNLVDAALGEGEPTPGWSVVNHRVHKETDNFNTIFMTVRNDVTDQYFTYTSTDAHGYSIPRRGANANLKQIEKPNI